MPDILSKLSGVKYFSLLDAKHGFWSLQLDDESSKLTTFGTPYGCYRFKCLPFRLSCAGDLFQAKIDEIFSDMCDSTQGIADDILVIGFDDDGSDHDAALDAVCAHADKVNLCFNEKKCIIHCTIAPFFGELVPRKGVKPDLMKLEAIQNLQLPRAKCELQSFLGMINYISKYTPGAAQVCKPL